MKRYEFTRERYMYGYRPDGVLDMISVGKETKVYLWEIKDDKLIVNDKWLKLEYKRGYVYALRKTKIMAENLPDFLEENAANRSLFECSVRKLFDWVIEYGKNV